MSLHFKSFYLYYIIENSRTPFLVFISFSYFIYLFIYLTGNLRHCQKYFNYSTAASFMLVGNGAVHGATACGLLWRPSFSLTTCEEANIMSWTSTHSDPLRLYNGCCGLFIWFCPTSTLYIPVLCLVLCESVANVILGLENTVPERPVLMAGIRIRSKRWIYIKGNRDTCFVIDNYTICCTSTSFAGWHSNVSLDAGSVLATLISIPFSQPIQSKSLSSVAWRNDQPWRMPFSVPRNLISTANLVTSPNTYLWTCHNKIKKKKHVVVLKFHFRTVTLTSPWLTLHNADLMIQPLRTLPSSPGVRDKISTKTQARTTV